MSWIIYSLIVGGIAGFIAGQLLKGSSFGLLGNIVIGVIGSIVGRLLFTLIPINMGHGFVGNIVTSIIGAILFLFIYGKMSNRVK